MKINIDKLNIIIRDRHAGDYRDFSDALEMSSVSVWRVVNGKTNPGEKFLGALMNYCKMNDLSFESLVFFKNNVAQKQ